MESNADDLFYTALQRLRGMGRIEDSRNGKVLTIAHPQLFTLEIPQHRVVFNKYRRANPYFHVMETVWMFAGAKKVGWLKQFNSNISSYAEDNGEINGAYGHRWRQHFDKDQIMWAVNELRRDPTTRQAVIAMYDPPFDQFSHWKDRPCNTHLYFRIVDNKLSMTVCNRSNDVVWGMCGANIVHMTYLQELVAGALQLELGPYYVMTNNLHIYEQHWDLIEQPPVGSGYYSPWGRVDPAPLLAPGEDYTQILADCEVFSESQEDGLYETQWVNEVVLPMYNHYMCRLNGDKATYDIMETKAPDWRRAERLWREWHDS